MADRGELASRPPRAPMPARSRRRWAIAGAIGGLWLLLLLGTHSIAGGTALLLLIAALGVGIVAALRWMGIDRDHPLVRRAATRPWRDGRDVLQLALRHLPEVFVITPNGSLLAPNLVELRMNPADVASLTGLMELEVINSSASEVYAGKVAAHAARLASGGPPEVSVVADPDVPGGRYRLRQGRRPHRARPDGELTPNVAAPDGRVHAGQPAAPTLVGDVMTVAALQPPLLRLVTNGSVAETRISGARAGRSSEVELQLAGEPTVSRLHAQFSFADGHWRITSLGRNGVLVNDVPVADQHPIRDGDVIKWGPHPGALESRVEVR